MNRHARHFISIILLLAAIILGSCQSQKERDKTLSLQKQNDSLKAMIDSLRKDFELRLHKAQDNIANMRTGLWRLDTLSETGRLVFAIDEITDALNAVFRADSVSQFKVTFVRNHTAFVRVLEANRLTQGLGSVGAKEYLAQVTFSLTSVAGIEYVSFEFEEGDHAAPGTYSRERFAEMVQ
jgi:hypothetical protein